MKWKLEIYVAVRKYIPVKMDENLQKNYNIKFINVKKEEEKFERKKLIIN